MSNANINITASTIAGTTGAENICNMWHDHYKSILNSCEDFGTKESVLDKLSTVGPHEKFTTMDVKLALKDLKCGKSPGTDLLSSEHFIYANDSICVFLSLLFNAMFIHSYLPGKFMETTIVPLLKDKKGDVTDKENYRPIAITSAMSKVFETVILHRYKELLYTSDHQFSFKAKHGTDQCVFVLKEMIEFYARASSPIYLCFMDASKAFDRVNHHCLLNKLLVRGIPSIVVRLLYTWLLTQSFVVRWSNILSEHFTVLNGFHPDALH